MFKKIRRNLGLAALGACTFLSTLTASAGGLSSTGGYSDRPLVLPKGKLRIDAGPSDYAYMNSGDINNGRGLTVSVGQGPEVVTLAGGGGVGIIDKLEAGAVVMPLQFAPRFDFGNLELYGRYLLLEGKFEIAGQLAMRIPTDNRFGVGLGAPMLWHISDNLRLDTGVELEIMTTPGGVNLDIPLAFAFDIGNSLYLGPKTAIFLPRFQDIVIPLGFFIGATIKDVVDISGSVTFENFMSSQNPNFFAMNRFEIAGGATFFFDIF